MSSGFIYRLVVRQGPELNEIFELDEGEMIIGRDYTNHIALNDPEVSREHAKLVRTGSGYAIEDLNSTNGTFINQEPVTGSQALKHGDCIRLGKIVELAYEIVGAHWAATIADAPSVGAIMDILKPTPGRPVNINKATAEEIALLPGVGAALAEAIVSFREEHGSFGAVEDIFDVPGMDAVSVDEVAELIAL
jgi:competence ComEA-like helix-hairpin-helix protein